MPSYTNTYSLDSIKRALEKGHGSEVTVRCRYGSLNEIWYHFNVAGSLQEGRFVASRPDGPKSNCPSKGIRYQPKRSPPPRRPLPTTTRASSPTHTTIPFTGKGFLGVMTPDRGGGCLISRGWWYTSGTCATFRTKALSQEDGTFTLHSSKGPCTFERNVFTCGLHHSALDVFTVSSH